MTPKKVETPCRVWHLRLASWILLWGSWIRQLLTSAQKTLILSGTHGGFPLGRVASNLQIICGRSGLWDKGSDVKYQGARFRATLQG